MKAAFALLAFAAIALTGMSIAIADAIHKPYVSPTLEVKTDTLLVGGRLIKLQPNVLHHSKIK